MYKENLKFPDLIRVLPVVLVSLAALFLVVQQHDACSYPSRRDTHAVDDETQHDTPLTSQYLCGCGQLKAVYVWGGSQNDTARRVLTNQYDINSILKIFICSTYVRSSYGRNNIIE